MGFRGSRSLGLPYHICSRPAELTSTALVSVLVSVGRGKMLEEKPGSVQAARGLLGFVRFLEQVAQL